MNVVVMPLQRSHLLASPCFPSRGARSSRHTIPEADGLVVRATGDGVAVGRPGQAAHAGHVADEGVHVRAGGGIPDLEGGIGRGGGDEAAVGRDAHLRDGLGVAVEDETGAVVRLEGFVRRRWLRRARGEGVGTGAVCGCLRARGRG